jgi:hypothetical protein
LNSFLEAIKINGLVVSATKIKLFQTNIRFLGYNIHQSKISSISRVIQFADKFPDEILEKAPTPAVSTKIKLFQTNIRFLGYNIHQSKISPISRVIQFADKFPDEILEKAQLQQFLLKSSCSKPISDFLDTISINRK